MNARASSAALALLALSLAACGGGGPLLHPAHTLPKGDVTFAAGTACAQALCLSDGEHGGQPERQSQRLAVDRAFVPGVITCARS